MKNHKYFTSSKNSVNRYIHWQVQLLWSNTLRTYFFIVNNA